MSSPYRKKSIEKLSSPEQLDRLIVITSPMVWLALLGMVIVTIAVIIWGFAGTIPTYVEISGMFSDNVDSKAVYSLNSGEVHLNASKGDEVREGDLLAVVDDKVTEEQIAEINKNIEDVKNISLFSLGDVKSEVTSQLLEIKLQLVGLEPTSAQLSQQLSDARKMLAAVNAEIATLTVERDATKAKYESLMNSAAANTTAFSELESAQSALQVNVTASYATISSIITGAAGNTDYINARAMVADKALAKFNININDSTATLPAMGFESYFTEFGIDAAGAATLKAVEVGVDNVIVATKNLLAALTNVEGINPALSEELTLTQTNLSYLEGQLSAKNSEQLSIESSLLQTEAQITGLEEEFAKNNETITAQFDTTKAVVLQQLEDELEQLKKQGVQNEILSPYDGIVSAVSVQDSQPISQGGEIFRVLDFDENPEYIQGFNTVVCFVPIGEARKIEAGMTVAVTPVTVEENEYGHINGRVAQVASYNATSAEMLQELGDELLVNGIQQQQGASVRVVIELNADDSTASGFEWSNKRGNDIIVTDDTPAMIKVITEENPPITKLLPYLQSLIYHETEE